MAKPKIKIVKDGPYLVTGNVQLNEKIIKPNGNGYVLEEGRKLPQTDTYVLCRCGHTQNPPFCDGSHIHASFDGTETASRERFENRVEDKVEGGELTLLDDGRCAFARFCHREEGNVWSLTEQSCDPQAREEAIIAANECPAGRFDIFDKMGRVIEFEYEPSIEILQDPMKGVSGPIAVKGRIPLESSDGSTYEIRNRVALCRCGKSKNKPFCDAFHIRTRYKDKG